MPQLVLGPLLRYVDETQATVWVETDASCEVEVLGRRETTFTVEGHHYALVPIRDLEPGQTYEYEVALDGERCWPEHQPRFPASAIRTVDPDGTLKLVLGSRRVAVPHEPPYTLARDEDERGREKARALLRCRTSLVRCADCLGPSCWQCFLPPS
jgi:hypothetical protein